MPVIRPNLVPADVIPCHLQILFLCGPQRFNASTLTSVSFNMAKLEKKAEKKSEKKATKPTKTEVKDKAGKKAVDVKKPVATVPSAKHGTPISSKEILARVCIGL